MKNILLILLLLGGSVNLKGQRPSGRFRIDACLRQINAIALMNYTGFLSQLEKEYHQSATHLDSLHREWRMQPADIYLSLEISKFSNYPLEEIFKIYQQKKKEKWSDIAGEFNIRPGSVEFQVIVENARLKSGKLINKKSRKNLLKNPKKKSS